MGIYIGHHPNPFISHKTGIETKMEEDFLLDQNVEWLSWQEEDGKTSYNCETIIMGAFKGMGESGVADLIIHIFIMKGRDQEQVNLLKTSVKSLQIVRE